MKATYVASVASSPVLRARAAPPLVSWRITRTRGSASWWRRHTCGVWSVEASSTTMISRSVTLWRSTLVSAVSSWSARSWAGTITAMVAATG